jgi:hypothetical protein
MICAMEIDVLIMSWTPASLFFSWLHSDPGWQYYLLALCDVLESSISKLSLWKIVFRFVYCKPAGIWVIPLGSTDAAQILCLIVLFVLASWVTWKNQKLLENTAHSLLLLRKKKHIAYCYQSWIHFPNINRKFHHEEANTWTVHLIQFSAKKMWFHVLKLA